MGVLKAWDGTDWRKVGCGGAAPAPSFGDDFNRADSLTSVGGSGWVAQKGTWGILDNRLVCRGISAGAGPSFPGGQAVLRKDSGSTTIDLTVEHRRRFHNGTSGLLFGYDPSTNQGYWFELYVLVNGGSAGIRRYDNGSETTLATAGGSAPYYDSALADSAVLRFTFDPGTGVINVYRDGALLVTATDSSPFTTGTWVGVMSNTYEGDGFTTNDVWDEPPSEPGRLRLRLPDGSWVREVCDDDTGFTFTDDFNRADSSTTLGAPWIVASGEEDLAVWDGTTAYDTPVWGISSNTAYNVNSVRDAGGTGHPALAVVDAGSGDVDMTVTLSASVFSSERNTTGVIFRAEQTPDVTEGRFASYFLWTTGGTVYWKAAGSGLSALSGSAGYVAAGSVMRVLASGSTIELYVDGSLVYTVSSSDNLTATCHGLAGNKPFGNANRWDDFSISAPLDAHPLKIEDPANPGTWITVACFTPV